VEVVAVDLNIAAERHVSGGEPVTSLVKVFVLSLLKELSRHDSGVLLLRLVDGDRVVS